MDRPCPRDGEVLLEVVCTGLCRTDLLIARDELPVGRDVVLGHEFAGRVSEPNGSDLETGALVAVDPTFGQADGSDGFMGRHVDGCIATWVCVPSERVFPVPPSLSPRHAAYLEPVAAAMGGTDEARRVGGRGLLVGDNRIADLTASIMRSDPVAFRFDRCSSDDLTPERMGGRGYDWIIETRLSPALLRGVAEALRPGGTLVMKSRHANAVAFPAMRWAERQLNLCARSRADFPRALGWLVANHGSVTPLLGGEHPMEDWEDAVAAAWADEGGKVFITS